MPKLSLSDEMKLQSGDSLLVEHRRFDNQDVWVIIPGLSIDRPSWFGSLGRYATGKQHDLAAIRHSIEKTHSSEK